MKNKDIYTRNWIIEQSVDILSRYERGILTIRGLHYQLVSRGMTNDIQHYKRVVSAMEVARWSGQVEFEAFSDRDRSMCGETKAEITDPEEALLIAKEQVRLWMQSYRKNRWENQPFYPEVLIEKKALEGVFTKPCAKWDVAVGACKGYPSLTFLYEMSERLKIAQEKGQRPIILYFGDYDPSGEDIPRSIGETLTRFNIHDIIIRRISLTEKQVLEWHLPPAPAKVTDSRTANWNGLGQVELDAVKPETLIDLLDKAVLEIFDWDAYDVLIGQEHVERRGFQTEMKNYVKEL
ncbi:MAG: hypothetical protein E7108_01765 [Bacteroidales bacterium]|nr:hypothetical protein [Bacteroidales bacterium]